MAAAALGACSAHSVRPACPQGERCLFAGNGAEPATLDPALATGAPEIRIIDDMMEGLVANDAAGRPIPGIASSWDVSPDHLTWTFHLRPARWSDGSPVTADDFVLGVQRALDPKVASPYGALLYAIRNAKAVSEGAAPPAALGVTAPDARTVRIALAHPAPYLLQLARQPLMMPAPRQAVARWGQAWTQPGHYLSDGPYVLQAWTSADHVVVVKNRDYYAAAQACLDRVVYYPTEDYLSAERRVRRGELDMQEGIKANRVAFLRRPGQIPAYVHVAPYLGTEYLAFNRRAQPALADRRVRQALAMAIDKAFITGKLLGGVWTPADSFVPPGTADYPGQAAPPWASWPLAQRQAQARRLLAQAGYGPARPLRLSLLVRSTVDTTMVAPAIQADWNAIGVDLAITPAEGAVAYAQARAGAFEVFDAAWLADYDDAADFLYRMRSDAGPMNYPAYADAAFDAWLDKADAEPDPARRGQDMAQAERGLLQDAAIAPIWYTAAENLVSPRVSGWVDNLLDVHPARFLCVSPTQSAPGGR